MGMYNPPHPGEIIREFCVDALELSVTAAANALGVSRETFSALLNGRSGINPEMALRLSKVFGRTPEGWLRLQLQYDLWKTEQNIDLSALKRIKVA
jgi:addiction module HigA family antidote